MNHHRPFLTLWVLAVAASVLAFVLHLAMRGRTMALGYELGKARGEQARLREVKRVHELEVASYQTPQRVEMVARSVLHMEPPSADRIITMRDTNDKAVARVDDAPIVAAKGPTAARNTPRAPVMAPTPPAPVATELLMPRITPPKTATSGAPGLPGAPGADPVPGEPTP